MVHWIPLAYPADARRSVPDTMDHFEWDEANTQHLAKHDILPEEVEQVFNGITIELEVQVIDGEERYSLIGETLRGRILTVVATWRAEKIRIVTAWDTPKMDKQRYLQKRTKQWHRL